MLAQADKYVEKLRLAFATGQRPVLQFLWSKVLHTDDLFAVLEDFPASKKVISQVRMRTCACAYTDMYAAHVAAHAACALKNTE